MKKLALIALTASSLTILSCNNEEKKTEEVTMDQAVEQMTQALDSANVVAPATDSAADPAAH
ncbi:MAG: hypothetical protein JNL75_09210 [Chitinophagales bacterium]|nr:hypothetical protein [Chitinophagales bacterium]